MNKRRWLRRIEGVIILCLMAIFAWAWVPADISGSNCDLADNGAWISVDWTSNPVNASAIQHHASSARQRKLRYLFVYTSYLKADGTFSQSDRYANDFVSEFRRFNQDTLLLAWLGIPIGISGGANLADASSRDQIAEFSARLVQKAGFDGVHLDVETVLNGDKNYLSLLEEVRNRLGKQSMLSIAGSHWMPEAFNAIPGVNHAYWTDTYYQEVAKRVDQIAVMTYDSFTSTGPIYRLWMREQIHGISHSVVQNDVKLLVGISVALEDSASHHPNVETLTNGLAGMCAGSNEKIVDGVAIYADWDFSNADQTVWREWLR
jgi:hypothetical protein